MTATLHKDLLISLESLVKSSKAFADDVYNYELGLDINPELVSKNLVESLFKAEFVIAKAKEIL